MERSRFPIAFGEGLDKETGSMVVQPNTFEDLRNVFLHEGKLVLRSGFTARGEFAEVDRIIGGVALKAEQLGIVLGYSSLTQRVYVYRVGANGADVELLDEWVHDRGGWGAETPVVHLAEVYGRVFFAHDEARITRRAPTMVYDPVEGGGAITQLEADFDGTGGESLAANIIRFRGVVRHLSYLVGWGFGSASENRPELVRISLPGQPTVFERNAYFIAGDRRDPVVACAPAGGKLMVWKRTEAHVLTGYDRRSFGLFLLDPRYGLVGSRLVANVGGVAIAWSEEGPRAWTGDGPSEGIDLPLNLDGWEPSDLAEEGAARTAFALYVPGERVVWFVFGRRVYALTVRVPGRWRWSYAELGFNAFAGFTLFGGGEAVLAPEGYPIFLPADGSRGEPVTVPAGSYVDIGVRNINQGGDETLEVWLAELVPGSGDVQQPSGGVFVGATDFRELPLGDSIHLGEVLDENPDALPLRFSTGITQVRPNVVVDEDHPAEGQMLEAVRACNNTGGCITFPQIHNILGDAPLRGRVFARIYLDGRAVGIGGHYLTPGTFLDWSGTNTNNWLPNGRKIFTRPGLSSGNANVTFQNINQLNTNHSWATNQFNMGPPDGDGWFNVEIQFEDSQIRVRMWEDVDTEPGWQYTTAFNSGNGNTLAGNFALIFEEMRAGAGTERTLCSYFAITTDPTEAAIPYPGTAGQSGEVQEPSPGVYTFWTDFSELPLGPMPLDSFVWLAGPQTFSVVPHPEDEDQRAVYIWNGGFFNATGGGAVGGKDTLVYAPWDDYVGSTGDLEVLARGYQRVVSSSGSSLNGYPIVGVAMIDQDGVGAGLDDLIGAKFLQMGAEWQSSSGGNRGAAARNVGGTGAAVSNTHTINGVNILERRWVRVRRTEIDPTTCRYRVKHWTGALEDEPADWQLDNTGSWLDVVRPNRVGVVAGPNNWTGGVGMFDFLAFSTSPDLYGPLTEIPEGEPEWFLARTVAVSAGSTQVVRVTQGIEPGRAYLVALRHRRGTLYNAGAEDASNPALWPSVSRGTFETTVDPPTILGAVWSRTAADAERVTLTIQPVAGLEAVDIEVWRREGTSGAFALLGTISAPHTGDVEYADTTIDGERIYQYAVLTATTIPGALGTPTSVWAGPAAIPTYSYQAVVGAGYLVGFVPGDAALATELRDAYDDNGGVHAMALRATVAAAVTEVSSGTLANVPNPSFTFPAELRHKLTSFGVDDFGLAGPSFDVTVPGSE